MTPYIVFYITEFVLILACAMPFEKGVQRVGVGLSILLMVLFSGLRDLVGFDTAGYHEIFRMAELNDYPGGDWLLFEPLFSVLMFVSKALFDDPYFFMFIVSALQGVVIYLICGRLRRPWIFLLVYLCGFYLQNQFNIVRAGLATLLLFLGYLYMQEGRRAGVALIGSFFVHYSALMAAPFVVSARKVWRAALALALAAGAAVGLGAGDRLVEKFTYYFIESSFYSQGEFRVGPYFFLTAVLMIAAHRLIHRASGRQIHALFVLLLVFKVLQILFPILWRSYDLLFFLWISISAYEVSRHYSRVGVVYLVAISLVNFWFGTVNTLVNEEANLINRVNESGEMALWDNESPFVPYRSFLISN